MSLLCSLAVLTGVFLLQVENKFEVSTFSRNIFHAYFAKYCALLEVDEVAAFFFFSKWSSDADTQLSLSDMSGLVQLVHAGNVNA